MKHVPIEMIRERMAELNMDLSLGEISPRGEFELACLHQLLLYRTHKMKPGVRPMSNIDKRALRDSAESIIGILENIAGFEPSDIDGDAVELRFETEDGFDTGCDVSIVDQCQKAADVVRALLDELEAKDRQLIQLQQKCEIDPRTHQIIDLKERIAELEALQGKPVMFIDGDISPADAEKLAAVIREFSEETETPAARMARIIRENPHPTNMCDMPAAGTAKGE